MKWIVERTPMPSFQVAMLIAQLLADADRLDVPIIRARRAHIWRVVKIVHPKQCA